MATHFQTMLSAACLLICVPVALHAEPLQTWPVESSSILQLAYSPDGQYLATTSEGGKVQVLRRESGGVMSTFDLNRGKAWGLAWSPDSKVIAVGGIDYDPPRQNGVRHKMLGKIRVWNVSEQNTLISRDLPDGAIFDVDISASGNTVAAAGYHPKADPKGWVDMWKIANGQQFNARYGRPGEAIFKIQFAPDGKSFFVSTAEKVYQYSFETLEPVIIEPKVRFIQDIAISPDGRYLAIASGNARSHGATHIWDIQAQREQSVVNLPPACKPIMSVAFSNQGDQIVMGSGQNNAQVMIARVTDGELYAAFSGHSESVASVAFSPDGKEVAAGDEAGNVKIWEVESGTNAFWFSKSAEWDGRQLRARQNFQSKLYLVDSLWGEGEVKLLSDLSDLGEVEITLSRIRPEQLGQLAQLTGLQELTLDVQALENPNLDFLSELPQLHTLDIRGLDSQGNGLQQIARLPTLKTLKLRDESLRNIDLAILGKSKSLENLVLHSSEVSSAGMEQLRGLTNLKELRLLRAQIDRENCLHLAELPKLRSLHIGTVNEEVLSEIIKLNSLHRLEFDANKLTAEQMIHFVEFEMWPRAVVHNNPLNHEALLLLAVKNPMTRQERTKYYHDMNENVKEKLASINLEAGNVNENLMSPIDAQSIERIRQQIAFLEQIKLRYSGNHGGFGPAATARRAGDFAARMAVEDDIMVLRAQEAEILRRTRRVDQLRKVGLTKEEMSFAKAFNLLPQ